MGDAYPMQVAADQRAAGDDVKIVLLQDAVLSCCGDANTVCCKEDAEARGVGCGTQADYGQIVNMIFEADSVINW
jgi:hypothetical protein